MKKIICIGLALAAIAIVIPKLAKSPEVQIPTKVNTEVVKAYLIGKGSPLADHVDTLMDQKHWKLLLAISHIESSWCTKKIAYNCWGIGGDSAYRKYPGYDEAIIDANELIEKWQAKGRWLTVEDMNGSYVQPKNPNWENVVNKTLKEIETLF